MVSLISSSGGYINGRNSANLGLLIDINIINIPVGEIKGSSFMNLLIFYKILKKFQLMSIKINRLEEGHSSYPMVCRRPAEQCPSKVDTYVIDEELQHTDHLFLGVACFTFMNFV
jgi:hypothetical protein